MAETLTELSFKLKQTEIECHRRHERQNGKIIALQERTDADHALLNEKFGRDGKSGDFERLENRMAKNEQDIEQMKSDRRAYLCWSAGGALSGSGIVYLLLRLLLGG